MDTSKVLSQGQRAVTFRQVWNRMWQQGGEVSTWAIGPGKGEIYRGALLDITDGRNGHTGVSFCKGA